MIAGQGIKGNQVIGMTNESFIGVPIRHDTGQLDEAGAIIRPPDGHATVLKAAGLSYENVSNQDPRLIELRAQGLRMMVGVGLHAFPTPVWPSFPDPQQ